MTDQQGDTKNDRQEDAVIEQSDQSEAEIERGQSERKKGRRARVDGPAFPVADVERLLVHGEPDEHGVLRYPSHREIAERFGVAHSTISGFAKHHNCMARRRKVHERVVEVSDMKLADIHAEQVALTNIDLIKAIDEYIGQFSSALREGRVRCDSPADFNQLARLKAFLQGGADSRQEQVNGLPTLEEIQRRHKAMLDRMAGWTPEMLGYTPPRSAAADEDQNDGDDGQEDGDDDDDQGNSGNGRGYIH